MGPMASLRSWALSMFRVARPASATRNLIKTYSQMAAFWLLFLVAAPLVLHQVEGLLAIPGFRFSGQVWTGVAVFVVFGVGALSTAYSMAVHGQGTPLPLDSARKLVISGLYRFVRNPMGVTGLAQGAGVGIALGSPLMLAFVLCGGIDLESIRPPVGRVGPDCAIRK